MRHLLTILAVLFLTTTATSQQNFYNEKGFTDGSINTAAIDTSATRPRFTNSPVIDFGKPERIKRIRIRFPQQTLNSIYYTVEVSENQFYWKVLESGYTPCDDCWWSVKGTGNLTDDEWLYLRFKMIGFKEWVVYHTFVEARVDFW